MATTSQRPTVVLMAKGIKFRELAKKASFEFMSEGEAKAA
jgi:hypothetical protein